MPNANVYFYPETYQSFVRFSSSFYGEMSKAFAYIITCALTGKEPTNPKQRPKTAKEVEDLVNDYQDHDKKVGYKLKQAYRILCLGEEIPLPEKRIQKPFNIPAHLFDQYCEMAEAKKMTHAELGLFLIQDFFGEEQVRDDGLNSGVIQFFEKFREGYGCEEVPDVGVLHGIFGENNPLIPLLDCPMMRNAYKGWVAA